MTNREKFKKVFGKNIHWSSSIEPQILALKSAYIDGIDCREEWLNADYEEPVTKSEQVVLTGDGYADGKLVYDYGICPECGWSFEEDDKDWEEPFCCHCGQKLKWFDNKGEDEE